jgi:hypothetical protein
MNEPRTIAPIFKSVKINGTQHWDVEFLKKYGISEIWDVYIYDETTATYCCELTPSYALYPVDSFPVFKSDDVDEDVREEVYEQLDEARFADPEHVHYHHCSGIDSISDDNKHLQDISDVDKDEWDTEEEYNKLCESVCGEYSSNPDF